MYDLQIFISGALSLKCMVIPRNLKFPGLCKQVKYQSWAWQTVTFSWSLPCGAYSARTFSYLQTTHEPQFASDSSLCLTLLKTLGGSQNKTNLIDSGTSCVKRWVLIYGKTCFRRIRRHLRHSSYFPQVSRYVLWSALSAADFLF